MCFCWHGCQHAGRANPYDIMIPEKWGVWAICRLQAPYLRRNVLGESSLIREAAERVFLGLGFGERQIEAFPRMRRNISRTAIPMRQVYG